jgi:hypothetical protein
VVLLYSFVGSIVNLCNITTLIPPASRACCDVHKALGGAFPKRHHVDCGVIAIMQGACSLCGSIVFFCGFHHARC